jgi:hypothetical protein
MSAADPDTCGRGMAERARLPLALAELFSCSAENLEVHVGSLDMTDEHGRAERDVWVRVAAEHRAIAAQLRDAGELMERARDLPMPRHDEEALASPRVLAAFERLVAAEQAAAAALAEWVEPDRERLGQAREA